LHIRPSRQVSFPLLRFIHTHPCASLPQNPIVTTTTTLFTAFSSFGLAAVSTWFASERWIFSRHKGKRWLQDSLDDLWDTMMSIPPFHQFIECLHVLALWTSSFLRRTRAVMTHASSVVTSFLRRRRAETLHPPSFDNVYPGAPSPDTVIPTRRGSEITFAPSPSQTSQVNSKHGSTLSFAPSSENPLCITGTSTSPSPSLSPSRARFIQAVRNVIRMQQVAQAHSRSLPPTLLSPGGMRPRDTQPVPMQRSRVAGLVPKLRGLTPMQDLAAHQALVRHLQFSPNGRFLATSRSVSHHLVGGRGLI
jgi:WD repeat-containing protein 26